MFENRYTSSVFSSLGWNISRIANDEDLSNVLDKKSAGKEFPLYLSNP